MRNSQAVLCGKLSKSSQSTPEMTSPANSKNLVIPVIVIYIDIYVVVVIYINIYVVYLCTRKRKVLILGGFSVFHTLQDCLDHLVAHLGGFREHVLEEHLCVLELLAVQVEVAVADDVSPLP